MLIIAAITTWKLVVWRTFLPILPAPPIWVAAMVWLQAAQVLKSAHDPTAGLTAAPAEVGLWTPGAAAWVLDLGAT